MRTRRLILPAAALSAAAALLIPVEQTDAYQLFGFTLGQGQRDFRIFNNFTDTQANNNQVPDSNFPGYQGAVMAIWKGCIEWQSELHGNGNGDPTQSFGLGSGGANYDPSFQGTATSAGGINDNIHSEISGCQGGVLAYTESPDSAGWRIRYIACWTWEDGPTSSMPTTSIDLQGVACHETGHAIGLGHTTSNGATMYPSISGTGTSARSIETDDKNGVKAAYGTAGATKPSIDAICIAGTTLTITGVNFSASGNEVWFTKTGSGGTGVPIKVTNVNSNGTEIVVTIPGTAGPGDILVRNNGGANANVSNAWPTNLQPTGGDCSGGGTCPDPLNYCTTSPNSVGSGMVMGFTGSSCVSDQDFTLTASGGPPNQLGIFYYGENSATVPFGNGIRCVAPGIAGTFRLPVVQIDFFGDVSYPVDFTSAPFDSGPGAWIDGAIWNVQFWYRDPSDPPAGYNLSDGLEVTLGP